MGREIRMVPPNWQHSKDGQGSYIPQHDRTYQDAADEWVSKFCLWHVHGKRHSFACEAGEYDYFWEWEDNPPVAESYRGAFSEEPTWVQVYETVSEGTPVSPSFATKEELIEYLVENGDFWCQRRSDENPPSRESVVRFVEGGWAPSAVFSLTSGVQTGIGSLDVLAR